MIIAIGNKILTQIKKNTEPVEKVGVFVVPDTNDVYDTANVISVGEEIKADIKAGDTLLIYKNSGTDFEIDGEKYRTISITDILAKKD